MSWRTHTFQKEATNVIYCTVDADELEGQIWKMGTRENVATSVEISSRSLEREVP